VEEGAKSALADLKAVPPYEPGEPAEIKVEFKGTEAPRQLALTTDIELVDDRTIVSRADDWWTAWRQFFFARD
jgi:D-aminopeptidase